MKTIFGFGLGFCLISFPVRASDRFPDAWETLEGATRPVTAPVYDAVISDLQDQVQTKAQGMARDFVPFSAQDIQAIPAEAAELFQELPNGRIRFKNPAGQVVEMARSEWVNFLNEQEQRVSQLGASVREATDLALQEIPTDVLKHREQVLNELRMNAPELLSKIKDPLPEGKCPNLNLNALPAGLQNIPLTLPDHTAIDLRSFLHRMDRTQSVLCSIGYSMLDEDLKDALQNARNLVPGSPELKNLVQDVLNQRGDVFNNLGLSDLTKGLNLESFEKLGNFQDIVQGLDQALALEDIPGPQMINKLKNKLNVKELDSLKIPHIPDIKLPGKPERTPLNIKKRKRWDGLNVGKRDVVGLEGFAELAMGGSEVDQTLRADAQTNLYVFGMQFNVVDGLGELYAGPDELSAKLHVKFVGEDLFDPIEEKGDVKWTKENLDALTFSVEVGYQQTFMVGPVPVAVRAGGLIDAGFGYSIGLINTRIMGSVIPHVYIGGFATGGVGIAGLLSGGAGAELTIVGFRAPIAGGAQLMFDEEAYPFIRIFIDTDVDLHLLDGRVYAYAEFPVPFRIKKEKMDIFKWKGPAYNHKIMSWKIDIGRRGASMGGDILDQDDRVEAAKIEQAISLDNRKEAIEDYRKKLKDFANQSFQSVMDDARTAEDRAVRNLSETAQGHKQRMDEKVSELSQRLSQI
ncbi:hypothetical protein [Oligoflexus tunisiensis]|uniref:hypothetical protein n=1 Tax=Oligoflexus tunisiensis TaxID=708132 RepID=UPI00114CE2A7|nr:hypothetical protein [Oligoflexus tunisiensis]